MAYRIIPANNIFKLRNSLVRLGESTLILTPMQERKVFSVIHKITSLPMVNSIRTDHFHCATSPSFNQFYNYPDRLSFSIKQFQLSQRLKCRQAKRNNRPYNEPEFERYICLLSGLSLLQTEPFSFLISMQKFIPTDVNRQQNLRADYHFSFVERLNSYISKFLVTFGTKVVGKSSSQDLTNLQEHNGTCPDHGNFASVYLVNTLFLCQPTALIAAHTNTDHSYLIDERPSSRVTIPTPADPTQKRTARRNKRFWVGNIENFEGVYQVNTLF